MIPFTTAGAPLSRPGCWAYPDMLEVGRVSAPKVELALVPRGETATGGEEVTAAAATSEEEDDFGHSGRSAIILLGALAVHSILEMMALGLADTFGDTALLSLSIALHQVRLSFLFMVLFSLDNVLRIP